MGPDLKLIIAEAKAKYGEVFSAEVEDTLFLFRLLTRREYREILMVADTEDMIQEIACQIAVIYPTGLNFAQGDAGLPSLLAPQIIAESGFGSQEKVQFYLDEYRNQMNSFEGQAEATIQAAFPHITDDDMQEWTTSKFMKTLAKAEWLLQNIHGYPIAFTTMGEETEEGEEQEEKEPPTFKELGDDMRRNGLDPMIEYASFIVKPRPFAESPLVGGVDFWRKGVIDG